MWGLQQCFVSLQLNNVFLSIKTKLDGHKNRWWAICPVGQSADLRATSELRHRGAALNAKLPGEEQLGAGTDRLPQGYGFAGEYNEQGGEGAKNVYRAATMTWAQELDAGR